MPSGQRGAYYESKAVEYLKLKGYKILETNFNTRWGEIDIIGRDRKYLCFIEVKARRAHSLVSPLEAVDKYKQRKIAAAAKIYSENNPDILCRFDVVSINQGDGFRLYNLIKNAFYIDDR